MLCIRSYLTRLQLNLGVRPTFLTFARQLTIHRET
jgi:hypothetical protein